MALVRQGTGASWRDAWGALLIWQSTSVVVARASVQGLFARRAEFLRTPKSEKHRRLWRSITTNSVESLLALAGLLGIGLALTHVDELAGALTATAATQRDPETLDTAR